MNLYQSLNLTFFGLTIVALLVGFAGLTMPIKDISPTTWLFIAFYLFLRLKTFFDDHQYFSNKEEIASTHFKIGFVVGFISWILWAISGYKLKNLQDAYFF
jgi:uncharacterized membrane protein YfcA